MECLKDWGQMLKTGDPWYAHGDLQSRQLYHSHGTYRYSDNTIFCNDFGATTENKRKFKL